MMSEKNKNGSRNAAGRLIERLRRLRLSRPAVPSDEPEVGDEPKLHERAQGK